MHVPQSKPQDWPYTESDERELDEMWELQGRKKQSSDWDLPENNPEQYSYIKAQIFEQVLQHFNRTNGIVIVVRDESDGMHQGKIQCPSANDVAQSIASIKLISETEAYKRFKAVVELPSSLIIGGKRLFGEIIRIECDVFFKPQLQAPQPQPQALEQQEPARSWTENLPEITFERAFFTALVVTVLSYVAMPDDARHEIGRRIEQVVEKIRAPFAPQKKP